MFLNRTAARILLSFAGLFVGCKQMPPSATTQQAAAHAVPVATPAPPPPAQPAALQGKTSVPSTPQAGQAARAPAEPKVEDVEERRGPFKIGGQTFTVILHWKRLPGQKGDSGEALGLLEIVDAAGVVQHREEFPYTVENGSFGESCSASVNPISGSNGAGFLLDTGCLPSAPLSGGPWQIFGVIK